MEKRNPLVSIVIPIYNGSNYMREAIDSALGQTYRNLEIIVVNDGSTDSTEEIAKSYSDKIRYFSKENSGVSTALNLAIKNAKGEYISWLSHDDVYHPEKIEKQIEILSSLDDKRIVLFSDYECINNRSEITNTVRLNHEMLQKNPEYALLRGCLNGITLLLPRRIFIEYGYFDERLRCTQDYDLWQRISQSYCFLHIPLVLAQHRMHLNQDTVQNPLVISEGNDLWMRIVDGVSVETRKKLAGSEYHFYRGMALFLKDTPYKQVYSYVCQEANFSLSEHSILVGRVINFVSFLREHSGRDRVRFACTSPIKFIKKYLIRLRIFVANGINEWQRNGMMGVMGREMNILGFGGMKNELTLYVSRVKRALFPREVIFGKKAKIAYVVPGVKISGGVAIILNHVNRLKERGYDVRLLTLSLETDIDWFTNTVPVFSVLKGKQLEIDIDVMIATHWSTASFVDRSDAPRRLYFVQSDERRFNPENKEEVRAIEATYRLDTEYMTEARWIQRWLIEEFRKKAYYVPNGLDQSVFFPSPPIGESKKKIRVLLEGPIDSWFKGMRDAYAAVSGLDCELWIVSSQGKPPSDWKYDRFFECVPIGEMKDVYSSCDIFLKMSYMEGFFGPPMEAMACGCAVVVGKVTGYDEYIVNGTNALVVEQGDVEGAKKAVERLIEDTLLRKKLIENGKETVQAWGWDQSINLLEKVLAGEKPEKYYSTTQPARYEYQEEMNRLASVRRKVGL